jgi:transposase-like protein
LKCKTKSIKIKNKIDEKRAITPRWVIKFRGMKFKKNLLL